MEATDGANVVNMTGYWKLTGVDALPLPTGRSAYRSIDWPHRFWIDGPPFDDRESLASLVAIADNAGQRIVIPYWGDADEATMELFADHGFSPLFRQVAMRLPLERPLPDLSGPLAAREVASGDEALLWADIAGRSFGYEVPYAPVMRLMGRTDLSLQLGFLKGEVVATGMVYSAHGVAGIHMVGTSPDHRRKGYAREMMIALLGVAKESGLPYATLQASEMGAPLYDSLGFERRFVITSFLNDPPER